MGRDSSQVNVVRKAKGAPRYSFSLTRRIVNAVPSGSPHQILAVCGELGCGTSKFLDELRCGLGRNGYVVRHRSFAGRSAESATKTLVKYCNTVRFSSTPTESVAFLEDLPPADEGQIFRQARSIRQLSRSCQLVVLGLPPEAAQLLDSLEDVVTLTSGDLTSDLRETFSSCKDGAFLEAATYGYVTLLDSLTTAGWSGSESSLPSSYYRACSSLARDLLRPALSEEELLLRALLLLIGGGQFADVCDLARVYPDDYASELARYSPAFGLSSDLETFEALGSRDAGVLRSCLGVIKELGDVGVRAASLALCHLLKNGGFDRAALIAPLAEDSLRHRCVLEHAGNFLNCGKWQLVRDALTNADAAAHFEADYLGLVKRTLLALTRPSAKPQVRVCSSGWFSVVDRSACLRLLLEARNAQTRPSNYEASTLPLHDTLARALCLHLRVGGYLHAGKLVEALRLLEAGADLRSVGGIAEFCLLKDEAVCRAFIGDVAVAVEVYQRCERAEVALGCRGISSGMPALRCLLQMLTGLDPTDEQLTFASSACERADNAMGRTLALALSVLHSMAVGGEAQAAVRSRLFSSQSAKAEWGYAHDISRLISALVVFGQKGAFDLGDGEWASRDVRQLSEMLRAAIAGEAVPAICDELPPSVLWVAALLSRDLGDISNLMREGMPLAWRSTVARAEETWESVRPPLGVGVVPGARGLALPESGSPLIPEVPEKSVHVSLLGNFCMRVNGQTIEEGKLDRRGAKAVLEYLLLRDKMFSRRHEAIRQIWPREDLAKGRTRLYQATTAIRQAVKEIDPYLDIFSVSKVSESIALNEGCICCDVQEFIAVAEIAMERLDPRATIQAAKRADELYGGDLYLPATGISDYVVSKRDELRALYIDAMVAGAEVALQTGRDGLAVKLARNAVLADGLREDAFVLYIKALKVCGREAEALREYERYAKRVVRTKKKAPSKGLRLIVGNELGFSPKAAGEGQLVRSAIVGPVLQSLIEGGALGEKSLDVEKGVEGGKCAEASGEDAVEG